MARGGSLCLLLFTLAAYFPVWNNDFVDLDDYALIVYNPEVAHGLSGSGLGWAWTSFRGHYWHPLTWMSLQLDAQLFSSTSAAGEPVLNPTAFHAENLLWHAGSVLFLFGVMRRLTGKEWPSFLVAALFALHPMHVESVAWATERKDVLSVFFGVLMLWAYVRYVELPGGGRYSLVLVSFLLSLLAKPMLITLPIVLLLVDYWPLGRWPIAGAKSERDEKIPRVSLRRLLGEKWPLFAVAAAIGALTIIARHVEGRIVSLDEIPLPARIANAVASYGQYVFSTIWPFDLAVLYPHPRDNWSVGPVFAGGLVLLGFTGLAVRQARLRPWLLVGWLWFVIALLPVIGLAQGGEQARADRFTYWPHIGLFIALAWSVAELVPRVGVSLRVAVAGSLLVCLGLGGLTWRQARYWHDPRTLWEHALHVTGPNHVAHFHLGRYHQDQGQQILAEPHLTRAIELFPNDARYHHSLGVTCLTLGKFGEAAKELTETLKLTPEDARAWHNLGMVRLHTGDNDQAIRCLGRARELEPGAADTANALGTALLRNGRRQEAFASFQAAIREVPQDPAALTGIGLVLLADSRTKEAVRCFQAALRKRPGFAAAYDGMGIALARQGMWQEAAAAHQRAVQVAERSRQLAAEKGVKLPARDLAELHCHLGYALHAGGYTQAALEEYRAASARHADWPQEFTRSAWGLATAADAKARDPQLAYELATQAMQGIEEPQASTLEALAAALAGLKKFDDAAKTERQALDRAAASRQVESSAAMQNRLRLYEEHKPFTDS